MKKIIYLILNIIFFIIIFNKKKYIYIKIKDFIKNFIYKIKNNYKYIFIYPIFKKFNNLFIYFLWIILIFILKTYIFEIFYISSNSMFPTLLNGDIIIVNKFLYKFKIINNKKNKNINRKDIIVFKCPFNKKINYIKRIIGVPGDKILFHNDFNKINFLNKKNYLKINNKNIYYKLLKNKKNNYNNLSNKFVIPKNYYFVTGDNKINSYDSRYWGLLHRKYIIGKAKYRILNIDFYSNNKIFKIYFNKIK